VKSESKTAFCYAFYKITSKVIFEEIFSQGQLLQQLKRLHEALEFERSLNRENHKQAYWEGQSNYPKVICFTRRPTVPHPLVFCCRERHYSQGYMKEDPIQTKFSAVLLEYQHAICPSDHHVP